MKIAIYHNLPPGGAKRVLYEEVKELSKKHNIYLFELSVTDESFLDIKPFCKKVRIFKFNLEKDSFGIFRRVNNDWNNFVVLNSIHKKIAKEIDRNNFDVVLVHPDKYTQSPFVLRHLKTPSIYFCHELLRIAYEKELELKDNVNTIKIFYENSTRRIRKEIDKANAKSSTKIITNSKYTKMKIYKDYKKYAGVCYPGVDINIFKEKRKKIKKVLFLGNWDEINGYDLALESVKLALKKVSFDFKQIIFSKNISDNELVNEYSESMATICTSYNEPFGLIPVESMACKTPVLAVNEGGYRETIIDGVTGHLLPRKPEAFAERIVYLFNHTEMVKKLGEAGRKHVIMNFSWEKHVKCLEKHIYEVAKENIS